MSSYVLHELLAEGGMGAVYAGEEISPNGGSRPIACKIMNRDFRGNDELAALFRAEAETNRRISEGHDGLVNFYLWFRDQEDREFMIMELVPGCDLLEICAMRERISFDVVRMIARDVLDVLAYVHGQDIIHRDISPGNVLISRQGKVKLLDFGLAKSPSLAPQDARKKRLSEFRGKRPYVSPEVVLGQGADERSDLYSFASMLYELLTGAPPFGVDVTLETLRAKAADWSVPDLPEGIPEDLRALTMGLLRREPSEREPSMAAAARDMLRPPEDLEGTRAELASIVEAACQREPDARAKTRGRGSFAGIHIKGLFITNGLVDGFPRKLQTSMGRPRTSLLRYGAMSLVGIAALAALVLGAYNLHRDHEERAASTAVSATMDESTAMSDGRSMLSNSASGPDGSVRAIADAPSQSEQVPHASREPIERPRPRSAQALPRNTPPPANTEPEQNVGHYSWR